MSVKMLSWAILATSAYFVTIAPGLTCSIRARKTHRWRC